MKVVHLSTRYPPGPGGVERHVQELAHRQRARGWEVSVLTSDLFTEIPWRRLIPPGPLADDEGVHIHRHRAYSLEGELHYPVLPGLFFDLRRERPDLAHVHTYGTYQGFSAWIARRLRGIPYVLTAHFHPTWSIWGGRRRQSLRRFYDRFLGGTIVRGASRLIVQTREEMRLVQEVVSDLSPVAIIPPGHKPLRLPQADRPSVRTAWGVPGRYILFVGRLASNKGLLTLAEAFGLLAAHHPDLSLVLVGQDGGERPNLEARLRALGLSERVKLVGHLEDESMLAAAYHGAEVLVLPSEYEAFGLVLVEALSLGTPVVATRVGGMPEVVEEGRNGYLVPARDPPRLAEAVERILADPQERDRMGRYGREVTAPRYRWETVTDQVLQLYAEVLREPRGG